MYKTVHKIISRLVRVGSHDRCLFWTERWIIVPKIIYPSRYMLSQHTLRCLSSPIFHKHHVGLDRPGRCANTCYNYNNFANLGQFFCHYISMIFIAEDFLLATIWFPNYLPLFLFFKVLQIFWRHPRNGGGDMSFKMVYTTIIVVTVCGLSSVVRKWTNDPIEDALS